DWRRWTKQTPSAVRVAQKPIDFFGPPKEGIVQCLILHLFVRHFFCFKTEPPLSHQRVSSTRPSGDCRKMARRRVKHGFREQKRTSSLRACVDDVTIKTFRVNDASI